MTQKSQRLVDDRAFEEPAGLAPIVTHSMLIKIRQSLLHNVFRRSAVADNRSRDRQQPPGMLPNCFLKQIGRHFR
jgi:hypothetical protein